MSEKADVEAGIPGLTYRDYFDGELSHGEAVVRFYILRI